MRVKQKYRTHHLIRKRNRKKEQKKNWNLIEKNKDARILVILHLFYAKSWKEIREYLENLSYYNFDLIITVTDGMVNDDILAQILSFKKDSIIIKCENKGFDLRPFLVALRSVDLDKYDIVIKLQSKSTKRAWLYIYDQLFMRRDWFLDLYDGILSPKVVHRNIDLLVNDKSVGMVAADNLIVNDPWHKTEMVRRIAESKNLYVPDDYKFVAGTCFAMKSKCLENIQKYPWTDTDFETVPNTRGMSFAHFFERYICTQVENVWNMKIVGARVRVFRHRVLSIPSKILYRYSSNRLFEEDIKFDPEFFYWILDNKLIKWKYDDIPFKKIIYSSGNIRRPFIENEPYQYLKGNVEAYKEYCDYHVKNGLPIMSVERFENLKKSIDKNGYDERHVIIVNNNNELMDGQHRAACLCYKLGENALVKVLKIRFIGKRGIKDSIKTFIPQRFWKPLKRIKNIRLSS
ncbi:rhamnan synthesis F family protein [Streptococcus equinus]|uniref:rhamnan synthesis F family protein n=1 Tax=Streptococcus equinus TaxID=1335 RepID=UPI003BF810B1